MRRKIIPIVLLVIAIPALLVGICMSIDRQIKANSSGPLHVFQLQDKPAFLTDDLAVSKAKETIALDGYDLAVWHPNEDLRTKAPDGKVDVYFCRNTINANQGCVYFLNLSGKDRNPSRGVNIELKGDKLECQVWIPK